MFRGWRSTVPSPNRLHDATIVELRAGGRVDSVYQQRAQGYSQVDPVSGEPAMLLHLYYCTV